MRRAGVDLKAREQHRAVEGRRDLAHPAADVGHQLAVDDDRRLFVSGGLDARPDPPVKREKLSRLKDEAVEGVGQRCGC